MSYYRNAKRAFTIVGILVLGAVVFTVFVISIASASSNHRSDDASTYRYLQAAYIELHDSIAHLSAARDELKVFAVEVDKHCPNVLVGVSTDRYTFGFESDLAVIVAVKIEKSITSIEQNFIRDVKALASSDAHLRRILNRVEQNVVRQLRIRTPDICSEADAWLLSGFHNLPENMARFIRESEEISSTPSLLLALPMKSKRQKEVDLVGKIRRILPRFSQRITTLVVASRDELLNILGIRDISAGREH